MPGGRHIIVPSNRIVIVSTPPDQVPDAFNFTPQINVPTNDVRTSNTVTITGINLPTSGTVSNGAVSINGGSYSSAPFAVAAGDTVTVRHTSAATNSTPMISTVTIGGVSANFQSTTVSGGGSDGQNFFVANFNTFNQPGFATNTYNFGNKFAPSNSTGTLIEHLEGVGPDGGNCFRFQFNAGYRANVEPTPPFMGLLTGSLGASFAYGEPVYIRLLCKWDNHFRWAPNVSNKMITFGTTGTSPNSRIIVHDFRPVGPPEDFYNGGGNLGWFDFTQARPAWFGLSNTTEGNDFQNSNGVYGSLSVHNNISHNACGPTLITHGNNMSPPVPGPNSAAPSPGNCWYWFQFEIFPWPSTPGDYRRIWTNNNNYAAPTVDQFYWNEGFPTDSGQGIVGWNGGVGLGAYGDGHAGQSQGYIVRAFEIGKAFRSDWYGYTPPL